MRMAQAITRLLEGGESEDPHWMTSKLDRALSLCCDLTGELEIEDSFTLTRNVVCRKKYGPAAILLSATSLVQVMEEGITIHLLQDFERIGIETELGEVVRLTVNSHKAGAYPSMFDWKIQSDNPIDQVVLRRLAEALVLRVHAR